VKWGFGAARLRPLQPGVLIEAMPGEPGSQGGARFLVRVIAAGRSKNGNLYRPDVLRAAVPLFEGARVFAKSDAEHLAGKGRDVRNLLGRLVGPNFQATDTGGEIRATFEALESAVPLVALLREAAARGMAGDLFGFSIDADAKVRRTPEGRDVQQFVRVNSLDLIVEPSAGGALLGLLEAAEDAPAGLRELLEALLPPENDSDLVGDDAGATTGDDATMNTALRERMLAAIREAHGGKLPEGVTVETDDEALVEAYTAALTHSDKNPLVGDARAADALVAKLAEAEQRLEARARLAEARSDLRAALAESGLPAVSRERLREQLAAREDLSAQIVVEAIQAERDYLAKLGEAGKVTGLGGADLHSPADEADKLAARVDAIFDRGATGARSIREAYLALTGDESFAGRLRDSDPRRLRTAAAVRAVLDAQYRKVRDEQCDLREAQKITLAEVDGALRESIDSSLLTDIFGTSINKRMLALYRVPLEKYDIWRNCVEIVPINNFLPQQVVYLGGYGDLPTVAKGQPYQALATPADVAESYAIGKKGGTEDITMEDIRNDNVRLFQRIPVELSMSARRTLAKFVLDFIRTNPDMADGTTWFHDDRGNLGSAALDATNYAAARLAFKKQTQLSNSERLGISPAHGWIPEELEETAYNLGARATNNDRDFVEANQVAWHTVWYWTDATDWALTADTAEIPVIELGFLDGRQEPELFVQDEPRSGSMFSHDKLTWKVRHIYGGVPADFRGARKHVVAG
jgi:hypothetical protein